MAAKTSASYLTLLHRYLRGRVLLIAITSVIIFSGLTTTFMLAHFYSQTNQQLHTVATYQQALQAADTSSTLPEVQKYKSTTRSLYAYGGVATARGVPEDTKDLEGAVLPAVMDVRLDQMEKDIEDLKKNYDSLRQDIFNCIMTALSVTLAALITLLVGYWRISRSSVGKSSRSRTRRNGVKKR